MSSAVEFNSQALNPNDGLEGDPTKRNAGQWRALIGHLARPNPPVHLSRLDFPAVAILQGPDAYVSQSWQAAKHGHDKVVPAWNYAVVHAR